MEHIHDRFIATYTRMNSSPKRNDVRVNWNPEWKNGAGSLLALTEADLDLPVGTRFITKTAIEQGRKIIGIVTPVGNVIFSERYVNGEHGEIMLNLPRDLVGLYPLGEQTIQTFDRATGGVVGLDRNIGEVLAEVVKNVVK